MKNKHNTMNSASSAKTYIKMQGQILEDDDCACLLVEAIAKKSQNIKWSTKVDGKNVQHRLIRRVSMDQFYAILTGEEDAFYKMCMALPEVINSVVNEEGGVEVPLPHWKNPVQIRLHPPLPSVCLLSAKFFSENDKFPHPSGVHPETTRLRPVQS